MKRLCVLIMMIVGAVQCISYIMLQPVDNLMPLRTFACVPSAPMKYRPGWLLEQKHSCGKLQACGTAWIQASLNGWA